MYKIAYWWCLGLHNSGAVLSHIPRHLGIQALVVQRVTGSLGLQLLKLPSYRLAWAYFCWLNSWVWQVPHCEQAMWLCWLFVDQLFWTQLGRGLLGSQTCCSLTCGKYLGCQLRRSPKWEEKTSSWIQILAEESSFHSTPWERDIHHRESKCLHWLLLLLWLVSWFL